MISLTYLSSTFAPIDDAQLMSLLETSRRNNTAAGLSGMLLYAEGHFIQTLEGEADAVDAAFERISTDPRHHNIIVALREQITERAFGGWSMGFRHLTAAQTRTIPGFADYLDPNSELYRNTKALGRAGIFHRIFRDNMRLQDS